MPNAYERVSAHRRWWPMGTVVVGVLLPYNDVLGERVKDDNGITWQVVAESVVSCPADSGALKGTQA